MPSHASNKLSSHDGDGAVEATWSWLDIDASHAGDSAAESCWRWRYRGDLATVRCRCRVMLAMALQLKVVLVAVRLRKP
jgi:hypothetical protein